LTATSIPLGDARSLRVARNRARIIRTALLAGMVGTAVAAFLVARAPNLTPIPFLPPGSTGIIALDLSASVENGTLDRMYATLAQLAVSKDRFGLVVFSNQAYEALPPNTPARELAPFARFFHRLPPSRPGAAPDAARVIRGGAEYPTNPWASAFSFGTTISAGLDLARSIILANHVSRPSVWLISDLADGPGDLPLVARSARSYIQLGIALHVIGLNPSKADRRFFEGLLGPRGALIEAEPPSQVRLSSKHGFPVGLGIAAALLALLLAANELWSAPLRWGPRRVSGSVASA
jgi:hypothetical protein